MDLANRFVIILLALLVVFAAAVVVLLVWSAGTDSVDRLGDFVEYLNAHVEDDGAKVIVSLGSAVVALVALLVVFVELAPPEGSTVPVREVHAGNAVLSTDAVARRVEEEVSRVAHVTQSKAAVAARGKGVEVSLELQLEPNTNLASTSEAACQVVQDVMTNQLGVELVRLPTVKLAFARGAPSTAAPAPGTLTDATLPPTAPQEPSTAAAPDEPPAAATADEPPAADDEAQPPVAG